MSRVVWWFITAVLLFMFFGQLGAQKTSEELIDNLIDQMPEDVVEKVTSTNETVNREGEEHPRMLQATGRKAKVKRLMTRYVLALKVFFLGVGLPLSVAMATFFAWKSVTMSALAFGLAGIIGIKSLLNSVTSSKSSSSSSSQPPAVHLITLPQAAAPSSAGGWHAHEHKHHWHRDWSDETPAQHYDRNGYAYRYHHP